MPVVKNSNYESNMKHLIGNNPISQLVQAIQKKRTIKSKKINNENKK